MSPSAPQTLIFAAVAVSFAMSVTWAIQRRSGNAGIVDIVWSGSLGVLAVFYALVADGDATRRLLLALLAGIWSARLTFYLHRRVVGKPEDGRYVMLREQWGDRQQVMLYGFFQLQAFMAMVFSLPYLVVAYAEPPAPAWALAAAVGLWLVATLGEALADRQLELWKRRPDSRGRTCRVGLWRYSRHPNYFFEWLQWFVWPLLAWGASWWWVTLIAPAFMLYLLFKVTGIPYTEAQALKSRGDDYRRYQASTSAFFPWFPKDEKSS